MSCFREIYALFVNPTTKYSREHFTIGCRAALLARKSTSFSNRLGEP